MTELSTDDFFPVLRPGSVSGAVIGGVVAVIIVITIIVITAIIIAVVCRGKRDKNAQQQ